MAVMTAEGGAQVPQDYYSHIRTKVLGLVPEAAGRVLDVGGGIGASAAWLKAEGRASRAVVVDLVADRCLPQIDAAHAGSLEDPATLAAVGEDGPFDTILCLDVLEHLSDPWAVLRRLHAMLAPGGVVVASIPNVRNYKLVVPLVLRGRWDLQDAGILDRTHLRWFTRRSAVDLMTSSGLKLEAVQSHFDGPKKRAFNAATLGLLADFLTIQFYIRVRRVA